MNLAWLHQALHHEIHSKNIQDSKPRNVFNGHVDTLTNSTGSHSILHQPLTDSNRNMNFFSTRNRTSHSVIPSSSSSSSASSSSLSSSSSSSAQGIHLSPNTSFMHKNHVLSDLIRHSTKIYSLTTVAIIAGIFVIVTVATAAIVALFWCKRNSVFAFKGGEPVDMEECEMEEFDSNMEEEEEEDEGAQPLCQSSPSDQEDNDDDDDDDDNDEQKDYDDEYEEDGAGTNEGDEDAAAKGHWNSGDLSSVKVSPSQSPCRPRQTLRSCFPNSRRKGTQFKLFYSPLDSKRRRLLHPRSIFNLFGKRNVSATKGSSQSSSSSSDRTVQTLSLVTSINDEATRTKRRQELLYSSPSEDLTSQLLREDQVVSDDEQDRFVDTIKEKQRYPGYKRFKGTSSMAKDFSANSGQSRPMISH